MWGRRLELDAPLLQQFSVRGFDEPNNLLRKLIFTVGIFTEESPEVVIYNALDHTAHSNQFYFLPNHIQLNNNTRDHRAATKHYIR